MYNKKPSIVYGFHGIDEDIGREIILGRQKLNPSQNSYDWLGHGSYFWESSYERALQWATSQSKRKKSSVKKPFVIGAILDLGECMDLLDQASLDYLCDSYSLFKEDVEKEGKELPENKPWSPTDIDFKSRELDCAVIRYAVETAASNGLKIDSVRAAFWEGEELYPSAGFRKHNHIQIAIINDKCIKGFFLPRHV